MVWKRLQSGLQSSAESRVLIKSSRTQITLVTVSSFYCHLTSASGAWCQKLRDWGGASSSGHQAPKLKLCLITSIWLNSINSKWFTILHNPYCCFVYIPGTTCLHIPLAHLCLYYYLLSPQYTALHILFYCTFYSLFFLIILIYLNFLPIFIYILLCCVTYLHCPLSRPDPIYISLLIIFCIIEYVTWRIKKPWTLNLMCFGCLRSENTISEV